MSIIAAIDRSPARSSRSASALNLIGGTWVEGRGNTSRDIYNPADTAEMLAPVREAAPEQVDEACAAAARAFPGWRATPAPDRAHVLFKFRGLLEKNFSDVAHGGAKNHLLVLPDADLERILPDLIGSCFGSAGQRCLAGSVLVAVGDRVRQDAVVDAFIRSAGELKLGDGLDDTATLCPVVNPKEEKRIRAAIERGVAEGARLRLDGRSQTVPHRPRGCFIGPTVFDDVTPEMFVGREEIFGPVVSLMRAPDLDAAITLANRSRYGNTACLFTQSGAAARTFRERIQAGMLGINVGVPAPMGFFPFGGWKNSIYGYLNTQGADAVAFYTRKKVITERWFGAEAPEDGWV